MHSLQPQQNAQLRPRGHDENILEEAYRGRYARQRLLNFWPESSCGYHAIKRFVCIIQVLWTTLPLGTWFTPCATWKLCFNHLKRRLIATKQICGRLVSGTREFMRRR